jgi:hypothetical protein
MILGLLFLLDNSLFRLLPWFEDENGQNLVSQSCAQCHMFLSLSRHLNKSGCRAHDWDTTRWHSCPQTQGDNNAVIIL